MDTYHFSPVREALFNTLRKYVHRGQKDSVIGTTTTYALVNENHLDRIYRTKKAAPSKELTRQKGHQLSPQKRGDPLLTAHGNIRPYGQVVRLSFWSPSIHHILGFAQGWWSWLKRGREELMKFLNSVRNRTASLNHLLSTPFLFISSILFLIENRGHVSRHLPNLRCPPMFTTRRVEKKGTSPFHKEVNTRVISTSTRIHMEGRRLCYVGIYLFPPLFQKRGWQKCQ